MPRPKAQPKTEILTRIDPDEDFSDVDGDIRNEFELVDQDPTRVYHWAHSSEADIGQYTGGIVGYKVERSAAGGVGLRQRGVELKDGEVITKRDHVLLSCDKALFDKRQRFLNKKQREDNDRMFKKNQSTIDMRR